MVVYICKSGHPAARMYLSGGFHCCPICGKRQPDPEIMRRALMGHKPHKLPDDLREHDL